jgi:hypothetical protein
VDVQDVSCTLQQLKWDTLWAIAYTQVCLLPHTRIMLCSMLRPIRSLQGLSAWLVSGWVPHCCELTAICCTLMNEQMCKIWHIHVLRVVVVTHTRVCYVQLKAHSRSCNALGVRGCGSTSSCEYAINSKIYSSNPWLFVWWININVVYMCNFLRTS